MYMNTITSFNYIPIEKSQEIMQAILYINNFECQVWVIMKSLQCHIKTLIFDFHRHHHHHELCGPDS
jgi:hypothetical protein